MSEQAPLSENVDKKVEVEVKEPVKSQEQVFTETPKVEPEEKRVPLHELYKERNRRRNSEDEVAKLRSENDEMRRTLEKVSQRQDDDDLIAEAEKELGIDKDAARKLLHLQRKVAEKVSPKVVEKAPSNDSNEPILRAVDDFKRRASLASQDYEDWNEMIPSMQAIMAKEIDRIGLDAYGKSPEFYYSRAVKAQKETQEYLRKEAEVNRTNSANLAQTESGSGGTQKAESTKINQAVFDANRGDAKWVRENEDEIKQLWRQGKLK